MSPEILTAVQGVVGSLVLVAGAVVTWRKARAETSTAAAERIEAHMAAQDERMEKLECRLDASIARERLMAGYVEELRLHISRGSPPPPPPWPAELTHIPHHEHR